MPLVRTGGETAKLGDHYEALWRMRLLLGLLSGEAEWVVFEEFDRVSSAGVDAAVQRRDGERFFVEYHSVKRQNSAELWSPRLLARTGAESPLGQLVSKITREGSADIGVFVSMSAVELIGTLHDGAVRSPNLETLNSHLAEDRGPRKAELMATFSNLQQWLNIDADLCLEVLRRLRFECQSETTLEADVKRQIQREIMRHDAEEVDEAAVANHLAEFMRLHLGVRVTRQDVLGYLGALSTAYCWKNLRGEPVAMEQVSTQNSRFTREAEERLIQQARIPRGEASIVVDHVTGHTRGWVLLTEDAGYGKSCVLAQVVDELIAKHIPTLAFRFDTATPAQSLTQLKEFLNLKWSPVGLLDNLGAHGRSVLVIDQVDALSMVGGRRNSQQWDVLHKLIEQARNCPHMSIVLACRSFDLRNDAEIRALLRKDVERGVTDIDALQVAVAKLSEATLKECLASEGVRIVNWTPSQLEVLRVPLHLEIFLRCKHRDAGPVESLMELYDRYLGQCAESSTASIPPWDFKTALEQVTQCFSEHQAVAVGWSEVISRQLESTAERLGKCGVLSVQGEGDYRLIRFCHDTLFDHAFAKAFVQKGESLTQMLTTKGERQEHFRRTHCRQVLSFLRQGNPAERARYLEELRGLLVSPAVRLHLKHFLLFWLNALSAPTLEEWAVVQACAECPPRFAVDRRQRKSWRWTVYQLACWNQLSWFDLLQNEGQWAKWLNNPDKTVRGRLTWMLGCSDIIRHRAEIVVSLINTATSHGRSLATDILSWDDFHKAPAVVEIFARAFVERWPGLDGGGMWTHSMNVLPRLSRSAALRVLECIVLDRLYLKRSSKLVYQLEPLNWRQRMKERWEDQQERLRWSFLDKARTDWRSRLKTWTRERVKSLLGWHQRLTAMPGRRAMVAPPVGSTLRERLMNFIVPPVRDQGISQHDISEFLNSCATSMPFEFATTITRFVERLAKEGEQYRHYAFSSLWTGYRHLRDEASGAMASGLKFALCALADSQPDKANLLCERLLASGLPGLEPIVMSCWRANPGYFARRVLAFLHEKPERIFAQPASWGTGNATAYYARKLLEAVVPHLSDDEHAAVEHLILSTPDDSFTLSDLKERLPFLRRKDHVNAPAEDRRTLLLWWRQRDFKRYTLLSVLPLERLSLLGRRKITVWRSRYGVLDLTPPSEGGVRFMGSPFEQGEAAKMADDQLLGAMRAHDTAKGTNFEKGWSPYGFVSQMRDLAAKQRRRFLALLPRIDSSIDRAYRTAIIQSLLGQDETADANSESNSLTDDEVTSLVNNTAANQDRELALAIANGLSRKRSKVPEQWIDILLSLALEHPDPATPEDDNVVHSFRKDCNPGSDLLHRGINVVRGTACHSLTQALFRDHGLAERLRPHMPRLICDRSPAVRACLIELLIAWLNSNRDEAVTWFKELTAGQPELLSCQLVEHFLMYACQSHMDELAPLVDQLIGSAYAAAREMGIRQRVRMAFNEAKLVSSAEDLLRHSDAEVRKVVAEQAAKHWAVEAHRKLAERWISEAFDDASDSVHGAAVHVFREVPDDKWADVELLVMHYIRSRAFRTTIDQMLWNLDDANPVPVDLIIHIVRQALSAWKKHAKKPRRIEKLGWGRNSLSKHLRVAYTNAASDTQRITCLDLMDEMLFIGFHNIKDLVTEPE